MKFKVITLDFSFLDGIRCFFAFYIIGGILWTYSIPILAFVTIPIAFYLGIWWNDAKEIALKEQSKNKAGEKKE